MITGYQSWVQAVHRDISGDQSWIQAVHRDITGYQLWVQAVHRDIISDRSAVLTSEASSTPGHHRRSVVGSSSTPGHQWTTFNINRLHFIWKCSEKAYSLLAGETPSTSRMIYRLQSTATPQTTLSTVYRYTTIQSLFTFRLTASFVLFRQDTPHWLKDKTPLQSDWLGSSQTSVEGKLHSRISYTNLAVRKPYTVLCLHAGPKGRTAAASRGSN
jgi:hypothetical protein